MKKIIQLSVMIFVLLLAFDNDVYAQRTKKKKKKTDTDEYFDEGGSWKHKLWYGGGFTLGFSGDSFQKTFQLGVSPMVGYKITDNLSVGPRVSLTYVNYKLSTGSGVLSANPVSWDAGVFSRYKIIPIIFAHVEYQFESAVIGFIQDPVSGELESVRKKRNNFLLGLGYNSAGGGGLFGYEVLILYNAFLPKSTFESPFVLRFGLTYNF